MPQGPSFSGKRKPATDAVLIESVNNSGVPPMVSQVVFVIAAVVFGGVALGVTGTSTKLTLAGIAVLLLAVAVGGFLLARRNLAGTRGPNRRLALDSYGVWWSDGASTGRIAWDNLAAVGVGQGYEAIGGKISSTPRTAALELFPAGTRQATDQSSHAGEARVDAPPPDAALPSTRLRFPISPSASAKVEDAVARFGSRTTTGASRWLGQYSLGVVNTLTGGMWRRGRGR